MWPDKLSNQGHLIVEERGRWRSRAISTISDPCTTSSRTPAWPTSNHPRTGSRSTSWEEITTLLSSGLSTAEGIDCRRLVRVSLSYVPSLWSDRRSKRSQLEAASENPTSAIAVPAYTAPVISFRCISPCPRTLTRATSRLLILIPCAPRAIPTHKTGPAV